MTDYSQVSTLSENISFSIAIDTLKLRSRSKTQCQITLEDDHCRPLSMSLMAAATKSVTYTVTVNKM